MKKHFLLLITLCIATLATAQQPPQRGERHRGEMQQNRTPEQIAEQKTDHLRRELRLDDKQHKKVYKLYLRQIKSRESKMGNNKPADMEGFPGRGPGMNGGGPPRNGGQQMGMERPSGGRPPQREANIRAPREGVDNMESEKEIKTRDKKMKKILNAEQYHKWNIIETRERQKQIQQQWEEDLRKDPVL